MWLLVKTYVFSSNPPLKIKKKTDFKYGWGDSSFSIPQLLRTSDNSFFYCDGIVREWLECQNVAMDFSYDSEVWGGVEKKMNLR